jgi:glucosylceramidase
MACSAGQTCVGGTCIGGGGGGTGGSSGTNGSASGGAGGSVDGGGTGGIGGATFAQPNLVTSAPNAYWNTNGQLTVVTTGNADVTVDDTVPAQTWEGFGGAFNEMGWSYLSMLSQGDRDNAIQLLFGVNGAHFNLGRIPIGASDYAISRYTLDETANDTSLASFSISRDMQNLIPFVKAAMAVNPSIRFWASPWTPPTWMKSTPYQSGNTVSPFDGGTMKTDDATLGAFALYLIKFVQAYGQQGIAIEALAPQNEPNYGQNYPSCLWATSTFTTFVGRYLGPAITSAGLSTKIMLGTMSNANSTADPSIVSSVMGDATARSYIKVIGMQWGMQSSVNAAKSYNLPIWQTEHKAGNYPFQVTGENPAPGPFNMSRAPNDQTYGAESWGLIRDWIRTGVTAYSTWNMVLDTVGLGIDTTRVWPQNALLTVDTSTKRLNITPTYYVFRHLSQFVVPGARVVATSGGDAVAFKNPDGSIITVMYNSGAARTMIVAVGGRRLQFGMPANGWATVNSQ